MITIKLVFQGGGAKLVTLMAVASVLRDLEAEKRIRIATIAGTSAGAIAACMLAGNRTMDDYRDKVNTAGKELINHFKTSWPKAALAIKLWAGGTVFDENILRLFLQKVFNLEEGVDLKLGTLRIPTVIVASDVSTMGKYVYKSSNSSDLARNITDVLCDSCSLPFVFRSFRSSSFVVDGGVCSNLAAEELLRDDDGSHVLGFKFQDAKPSNPKNIWKYALAIMSSAISSGVRNNAERIRLSGGEVCELPNEFDTLEFEEALTRGLTTEAFTGIKERVRPKLEDSLKKFDRLERISKRAGNLPEQVFQTHRNLRRVFQYQVHKSATVITAFSLLDPSGIHYRKEDEVLQIIEYEPKGDMLLALRVGLSKGNATPLTDELSCRVETVDGNSIPATWVVLPDGGPEGYYHALIFLNAPVLREAGRVRVLLRTHQEDLLKALLDDKVHFMRSRAGKATPTAQEDLVVMSPLPEGAPEIRTVW